MKSLKNVKNEKCTLKDVEYGEKTEIVILLKIFRPLKLCNKQTLNTTSKGCEIEVKNVVKNPI